jgi:two-component system sensor histidine kinase GlrK
LALEHPAGDVGVGVAAARGVSAPQTRTAPPARRFYPGSFPMLILAGFGLAVLPLIFALINNAVSIHELAINSRLAVENAVKATQDSRQLIEQITNMERSARQYSILAEPRILAMVETAHRDFVDAGKRMRTLPLLPQQLQLLGQISAREERLFTDVLAFRDQPRRVAEFVDDYGDLSQQARQLDTWGQLAVERETSAMQNLAKEVNDFIYWQLVALIPVALFLVIGATILILRPIKQIEGALHRLGEGDFTQPVSVSGPRDLEELGRQIDWLRVRLIELEEQKTRFLHQISHELKTPLSAIREGAELMGDGALGPMSAQQGEVARILRENTLRLQRLIEDLLNYHTVQFQRSGLHVKRVELPPVIKRVADAHQLPMRAKGIKLSVNCPALAIDGDENKIEVILDNLISNAIKFSPPYGEISVAANVRGSELVVEVQDHGPGVPPEERERIFDPFYQGETQAQGGSVKGTGLGLAIVREYVAAHSGRVAVLDHPGPGALIQLRLPVSQPTAGK